MVLVDLLAGEIDRFAELLGRASGAWWAAPADGVPGTRAERVMVLLDELAGYGRQAGSGAPPHARVPRLGEHALGSQVRVLGADLVRALHQGPDPQLASEAVHRILAVRAALEGRPAPEKLLARIDAQRRHETTDPAPVTG